MASFLLRRQKRAIESLTKALYVLQVKYHWNFPGTRLVLLNFSLKKVSKDIDKYAAFRSIIL